MNCDMRKFMAAVGLAVVACGGGGDAQAAAEAPAPGSPETILRLEAGLYCFTSVVLAFPRCGRFRLTRAYAPPYPAQEANRV